MLPLYIAGQIAISQITPTAWWMHIPNGILF
jgi:hypothetical protein